MSFPNDEIFVELVEELSRFGVDYKEGVYHTLTELILEKLPDLDQVRIARSNNFKLPFPVEKLFADHAFVAQTRKLIGLLKTAQNREEVNKLLRYDYADRDNKVLDLSAFDRILQNLLNLNRRNTRDSSN